MNRKKIASLLLATTIATTAWTTTKAQAETYTVQSGDTLWKIASTNGTTVANLKEWNHLTTDTIYVGQQLTVELKDITYTVKSGDSISAIAKYYDVLIADIKIKNNLTSDVLKVGQVLTIPSEKGTYMTHTVKTGDTLSLISRDYFVPIMDLKTFNSLTSDVIKVGQVLKLTSETTTQPEPVESLQTATIHKVVSGDTLWGLSIKYGVSITNIKQWNNLTSDTLYIGQELKVSVGETPKVAEPSFLADGIFPLKKGSYSPFGDTWGDSRTYSGDRAHEGTDIMAPKDTPIYSATSGKIVSYGWSDLGGWRISIKTPEGYNLYYAHMSKYATGIALGSIITKGQLIGYVGNTGYGPVGTSGKFTSHLHFGMYNSAWVAMNPYNHLKYWESK